MEYNVPSLLNKPMRIAILFSGGKDSTFALYWAVQQGWDICCLVSLMPSRSDSWMFHTPNIQFVRQQAEALGLPLVAQATSGEKEKELDDLKKALQKAKDDYKIDGVVAGALASDYQQERVNRICEDLKLKTFAPLWHKDQDRLLREMIECGFEIIIQHIAAEGLSEKWLGRRMDKECYDDLLVLHQKFGMNPAGEGGDDRLRRRDHHLGGPDRRNHNRPGRVRGPGDKHRLRR